MSVPAPCCPRCGSPHLAAGTKGFGVKRAVGGFLLLGGLGLLAGAVGSKALTLSCMSCGAQWEPGPVQAPPAPPARPLLSWKGWLLVIFAIPAAVGIVEALAVALKPPEPPTPVMTAAPRAIPVVDVSSLPAVRPARRASAPPLASPPHDAGDCGCRGDLVCQMKCAGY